MPIQPPESDLAALGRNGRSAREMLLQRPGCYFRTGPSHELQWCHPSAMASAFELASRTLIEPKNAHHSVFIGNQAMNLALLGHDIVNAMHRKHFGWIDFLQGTPGFPPGFETGGGVSHIRAKRDFEHAQDPRRPNGIETLRSIPEVLAKGKVLEWRGPAKVTLTLGPFRAVVSRIRSNEENPAEFWLLTGFRRN